MKSCFTGKQNQHGVHFFSMHPMMVPVNKILFCLMICVTVGEPHLSYAAVLIQIHPLAVQFRSKAFLEMSTVKHHFCPVFPQHVSPACLVTV